MNRLLNRIMEIPTSWILSKLFAPDPKRLGPIDEQYVLLADRHAQCWKTERMVNMSSSWPLGSSGAHRWITNYQDKPAIRGGLWQRERKLR